MRIQIGRIILRLILVFAVVVVALPPLPARADGFGPAPAQFWHELFCLGDEVCTTGDFDGDGRADIITFLRDTQPGAPVGDVFVARSNGRGFQSTANWSGFFCIGLETCAVGDFDGDGMDDVVAFVQSTQSGAGMGDVFVSLSNGASFLTSSKWSEFFCLGGEICATGDFNGDGKGDILTFVGDSQSGAGRGDVHVSLSNGAAFQASALWHDFFCLTGEICATGDFNGDGKDDIVTFVRSTQGGAGAGDVYVSLSTGAGFAASQMWHSFFCVGNEICRVGDVNGDGKDDILTFIRDTKSGAGQGDVGVALSNGAGFGELSQWHDFFCIGQETCRVDDFNGDGKDDLLTFIASTVSGSGQGDVYVALAEYPPLSVLEPEERAADVGYNQLPAAGNRALLVVLVKRHDSSASLAHTAQYYEDLIFGPTEPYLARYYSEVSQYLFTWHKAAVVGPAQLANEASNTDDYRRMVKELAAQQGFNYEPYDTNHDGQVSTTELGILSIDNYTDNGGQTGPSAPGCVDIPGQTVDVCSEVASAGQKASLTLLFHETAHLLGSTHNYGSNCNSSGATPMSCHFVSDNRNAVHPDPWTKLELGWTIPRIYKLDDYGTCETLAAPQYGGGLLYSENHKPVVLYDPRLGIGPLGSGEFFILEHRNPDAPFGKYDAGVWDKGLALWYVQRDAGGYIPEISGLKITAGNDQILQTVPLAGSDDQLFGSGAGQYIFAGPDYILQTSPASGSDDFVVTDAANFVLGAPGAYRGLTSFWDSTNGADVRLRMNRGNWWDAAGANLRLWVGSPYASNTLLDVEWSFGGPFVPSVLKVASPATQPVSPGTTITLQGRFGLQQPGRRVSLTGSGAPIDLEIVEWTCKQMVAKIPANAPSGNYRLMVFNDAGYVVHGNWIPIAVGWPYSIYLPAIRR